MIFELKDQIRNKKGPKGLKMEQLQSHAAIQNWHVAACRVPIQKTESSMLRHAQSMPRHKKGGALVGF